MLFRIKAKRDDERLDRIQQNLLMAVKVSEQEINDVAGSPDLFHGLRVRIAAGQAQLSGRRVDADDLRAGERGRDLRPSLWARPSLRWALTAAAILLLAAAITFFMLPRQSQRGAEIAPVLPQTIPTSPGEVQPDNVASKDRLDIALATKRDPKEPSVRRAPHRHHPRDSNAAEVATDFFPLTLTAESAAPESGHVVRVKISRTALLAVGLPMNVARAGELITADVVIGDDGLARAIRFIQ